MCLVSTRTALLAITKFCSSNWMVKVPCTKQLISQLTVLTAPALYDFLQRSRCPKNKINLCQQFTVLPLHQQPVFPCGLTHRGISEQSVAQRVVPSETSQFAPVTDGHRWPLSYLSFPSQSFCEWWIQDSCHRVPTSQTKLECDINMNCIQLSQESPT